jgi:hypothetical protein
MEFREAINIAMASKAAIEGDYADATFSRTQNLRVATQLLPKMQDLGDGLAKAGGEQLLDTRHLRVSKRVRGYMKAAERELRSLDRDSRWRPK